MPYQTLDNGGPTRQSGYGACHGRLPRHFVVVVPALWAPWRVIGGLASGPSQRHDPTASFGLAVVLLYDPHLGAGDGQFWPRFQFLWTDPLLRTHNCVASGG